MDPVTHTLVGGALARTGLERRTALATLTLLVGANIPDVDVLAYAWSGEAALGFRRGLTHGVLALVVLPFVLTGLVLLWDRAIRRRRRPNLPAAEPRQVLLLAAIGVATHPLLDHLNVYGMRWLMPFSNRWFYGDTLFIVDPWVWMLLGVGLWLRRRWGGAPRLALMLMAAYVLAVAASGLAARHWVARSAGLETGGSRRVMVAPLAVTPFTRRVVVEDDTGYQVGTFHWLRNPRLELRRLPYDRRPDPDVVAAIARSTRATRYLSWARFPYYMRPGGGEPVVYIGDARYTVDPESSWAATRLRLTEQ